MLADIPALKTFLDEVFIIKEREHLPEISIKTRVGMSSYSEAEEIADLYAKYPLSGVIVHPRIRDDFYNNTPNLDAFNIFYEKIPHEKLVFNGDLKTTEDVGKILEKFPELSRIMTGRGLLADPFLPERISRCDETGRDDFSDHEKKIWLGFLEELYEEYERELSEGTALLKMKDLWNFMAPSFPEKKKQIKSVSRSKTGNEYRIAVRSIF